MWISLSIALAGTPDSDLEALCCFLEAVYSVPDRLAVCPESSATTAAETLAEIDRHLASIGDGHLLAGIPEVLLGKGFLPLRAAWIGDRAVITHARDPSLVGSDLLSIDGIPAAELGAQMRERIPVDGGETFALDAAIRHDFWRWMHRVVPPAVSFLVETSAGTRTIGGVGNDELADLRAARLPTLDRQRDRSILTLPTFGSPDGNAVTERIHDAFDGLTGPLVVDLRGNSGGFRDQAAEWVAHLVPKPATQWTHARVEIRPVPKALRKHAVAAFGTSDVWLDRAMRKGFVAEREGDPWSPPVHRLFRDPVEVWVDGGTASSAVESLVALTAERRGVRVRGEPTGGYCDRHTGQLYAVFTTPEHRVPVIVPLADIRLRDSPLCDAGGGVQPTERVEWTLDALRSGDDPWTYSTP